MDQTPAVRVDRWLWSVRLFKTRSLASAACGAGKVQVNGQACKPARLIRPGDILSVFAMEITRTVRMVAAIEHRVGAKLVSRYLEDLTSPAEYEKWKEKRAQTPSGMRPKGSGRPTKRDRRMLKNCFEGTD